MILMIITVLRVKDDRVVVVVTIVVVEEGKEGGMYIVA